MVLSRYPTSDKKEIQRLLSFAEFYYYQVLNANVCVKLSTKKVEK